MKYVNVVVDNNTNATDVLYSYACDFDEVAVGAKVKVPFSMGNRKLDAYVVSVSSEKPEGVKRFKHIETICDDVMLSEEAVRTALWMRNRCLCRYIEAIKCFLPISEVKARTKDPFADINPEPSTAKVLNEEQQLAFNKISEALDDKKYKAFLLYGVTGSGKTEVYLQTIEKVAASGKQGIILVPEISLTPQMVSRFISRFGKERIAVLHSKLTHQRRALEYKRIESGEVSIIIGARSAIFAPCKNIGAIILDEEHESTYKSDKSPKYDAIEVATKRAMDHDAVLILGSATPSVSDFYRSNIGIFERLELKNRYNSNPLPSVSVVDMTKEVKSGNRNLFSRELIQSIEDTLSDGKQVILFLNRRGYSSYISCRECGYVAKCNECGISMTYHKDEGSLVCHYCGRKQTITSVCPECGSKIIGRFGAGTQQVEEKVKELFPDKSVERLDLDVTSKKGSLEKVLKRFENGEVDILVGTQLIAKGLDVPNVGLVGIISADVSLNVPDFRSSERTFQLLTQAAGRSGRGDEIGKVIIQTYSPDSYAIINAANQDYESFFDKESEIRKLTMYAPFGDIYQIIIQDESFAVASDSAQRCVNWLKRSLKDEAYVLGPSQSHLKKAAGMYRFQVLVKAPSSKRKEISSVIQALKEAYTEGKNKAALLTVDINPYSFI